MIILGLGSNLGDREQNLQWAVELLENEILMDVSYSEIYETEALLPPQAEEGWEEKKFLNMAICGEPKFDFTPEQLLEELKSIEAELGRAPAPQWAPRVIDIDILAWDSMVYSSATLSIPHIALAERAFAAVPLADIAPGWIHPQTGQLALQLAAKFGLSPWK